MDGGDSVVRKPVNRSTCDGYIIFEDEVNFRRYRGTYKPDGYRKGVTDPFRYPEKRTTPPLRGC